MPIGSWSTTPASNNAAVPNGAPEGMAPSSVNDVIRQIMADVKTWYDATGNNIGYETGSFNVSFDIGYAAPEAATFSYIKIGGMVMLYGAAVSETSNATSLHMTGLPAGLQPSSQRRAICLVTSGDSIVHGSCLIDAAVGGGIGFYVSANGTGGFSALGAKGLPNGWQIWYPL